MATTKPKWNRNWKIQQTYDTKRDKVTYKTVKENPEKYGLKQEDVEPQTVPGQAISVKEILERYKNGRPQPVE